MIKAILFDADGVLIHAERFSKQLERDYGISTEITLPFFTGPFKDCLIGKADLKESLKPYLKKWGWAKGVDEFLSYWFRCEHKVDEELINYIQALRQKGIKCFLATNNERYRVQYMLDQMGFANSFDKVYASAHLGHKKPTQEFFGKVWDDLKEIEKSKVLVWDDDQENINGAKEFGFEAELYSNFADFKSKMSSVYLIND